MRNVLVSSCLFSLASSALIATEGVGYNPSYLPYGRTGANLYLEGDFLWMRAEGDGLGYAEVIEVKKESSGLTNRHIDTEDLNFTWDPGFRLAVGYTFPVNGWDLKGSWMSFYTVAKADLFQDRNISSSYVTAWNTNIYDLNQIFCMAQLDGATFHIEEQSAKGRWHWQLDDFSILLGKAYFPSPCFMMHPFMGVRAIYSRQKYKSDVDQLVTLSDPMDGDLTFEASPSSEAKNDFQAYGFQGGLEMRWLMSSCLHLFGTLSLSTVRGKVKSSFDEGQGGDFIILVDDIGINVNSLLLNNHVKNEFFDWKAVGDLSAGVRWTTPLIFCQGALSIFAAWEQHLYYNLNHFRPVTSPNVNLPNYTAPQGDLSLWGFSFGLSVDF